MGIHGTQTEKTLLAAFAGERQARNRYPFCAKKAREEKIEYAARIFEATAMNELAHAKRFFSFLEGYPVQITATYPAARSATRA
jgi:rubrerythrin